MTMKLPRKLLSCLLVLAICITTVFGCLITASAETTPSYTIADGVLNADSTAATVDVTFDVPSGMSAGLFDVANYNGGYASVTAEVKEGTADDIEVFVNTDAADLDEGDLAIIGFQVMGTEKDDLGEDVVKLYTSVTLTLTFTFTDGTAVKGNNYTVAINDLDFSGRHSDVTGNWSGKAGVIKTGCDHIVTVSEDDLVKTDSVNGYSVYSDSSCSVCGDPDNELGYQVVPTKVPAEQKVIYWDGTYHQEDGADTFDDVLLGSGSETDPYIIDSADDLALIAKAVIDSADKHFKVADGISAIVLQKESDEAKAIMSLNSAAAVQKYFEDDNIASPLTWTNNGWSNNQFKGTLDGNGATIYGLYFNDPSRDYTAGLFGSVSNCTVKNLTVKNSYIQVLTIVGAIIGCQRGGTVTLEQCAVANNYIRQHMSETTKNAATNKASVMVTNWSGTVDINNCMVYGNDARNVGFTNTEDGVGFDLSMIASITNSKDPVDGITNCICLGAAPYQQYNSGSNNFVSPNASPYTNVYTDQAIDGVSMYRLYNGAWDYLGKLSSVISNSLTATTMAEFKTQDFVTEFNENAGSDVLALDVNGGYPIIAPNVAKIDDTKNVLYYDNDGPNPGFITNAAEGVGDTPDNPYIITTANELMVITKNRTKDNSAKVSDTNFAGKYFKIADGIDVMVLQPKDKVDFETLKTLSTPEEIKAYVNGASPAKWWSGDAFAGHLDGNGVEICGMWAPNALFPKVYQGATIENISVKNSYVETTGSGGAIVGTIGNGTTTAGNVTVENCVVANCYIYRKAANANETVGLVSGNVSGSAGLIINNALTYNNTVINYNTVTLETTVRDCLYGTLANGNPSNSGEATTEADSGYDNQFSNSIFLDCAPSAYSVSKNASKHGNYTNVFTDRDSFDRIASYSSATQLATNITVIEDASTLTGLAANSVVTALNTANDGKAVWGCTANGYPTPLNAYADTINAVSSADLQLAAYNLTYNNDGSFNLNFHLEPAYTGFAPELYVAQADLSGFMKLEAQPSSYAGDVLDDDALMYVIENISAREIADTMLPTVIAANGNQAVWGKTESISVKDYAVDVINGEAVYTENATDEQKQQDKDIAAALINYGEAAKKALAQDYDGNASGGETKYWDGKTYTKPTDTDASGNILINNAEELAYIALKATVDETTGNNYKIADGISNIILQPESSVDGDKLMGLADNAQVKDYLTGKTEWTRQNGIFNGNFDGNGVTIYGLYQEETACGLFPQVDGGTPNDDGKDTTGITIKNISLKNAYMNTGWRTGAIFGYSHPNTSGKKVNGTINIEGCVVANCYMTNSDSNANNKGMFTGANSSEELHVRNCLVYNNYYTVQLRDDNGNVTGTKKLNFLGGAINSQENRDAGLYSTIENSVLLDISPNDGSKSYNLSTVNTFENVYTNVDYQVTTDTTDTTFYYQATDIAPVTTEGAQGSAAATAMPNLDWNTWVYGFAGEYPTPITAATTETAGRIEYWDGTRDTTLADNGEDGSAANPIIIDSAEELAQLVRLTSANTQGKNYKIADDIDAIILQSETVIDDADAFMALSDVAAVKKYFEDKIAAGVTPNDWHDNYSWSGVFDGNFDGNGVEIYGLYSNSDNAALFFMVDGGGDTPISDTVSTIYEGGTTFKNFAVKNAYLVTSNRGGAIIGQAYGASTAAGANVHGIINIDSCVVANSYMRETAADKHNYAGILTGDISTDLVNINNCLVYGNDAQNTYLNLGLSLRANGANNRKDAEGNTVFNMVTNTIVLGSTPYPTSYYNWVVSADDCFTNVYTDQAVGSVALPRPTGGDPYTINYTNITKVELADMIGSNAQSVVDAINAANGDSRDMYVGNAWGYPSFTKAGIMPSANQMAFDGLTMTNYDVYTAVDPEFSMYATSLNLKANPYIAFTFAFNGDYKTNRKDITVTFTTASGKTVTTKVADADGKLNAGWTNNAGAGRYHLYRLENVAVEDLCKPITVTVNYDGKDTVFGTFSVEGFALDIQNAYKQDPCEYYAVRVEAAKALLYYTKMVNARYGA